MLPSRLLVIAGLWARAFSYKTVDWRKQHLNSAEDRFPDFSFAGALSSTKLLPPLQSDAALYLKATSDYKDRTTDIQEAIDALSASGGGILQLGPGTFYLSSQSIKLFSSGVILRGTISDAGDLLTKIIGSGPGRFLFLIGDPTSQDIGVVPSKGASASILDEYVPVGSAQLTVSNPTLFHPGQEVQIQRTLTKAWIRALGMDKLVRDGKKQTWLKSGTITYETRAIQSVDKRVLHLDVPLTDSINATFGNDAKVVAWEPPPDRPQSVGLESLIVSPESDQSSAPVSARDDLLGLVIFTGYAEDCWTRNIRASGFSHAVSVEKTARRITIANILMIRPSPTDTTAGSPADILITGSRVLVYQCSTTGVQRSRSWNVATGTLAAGPNAVVQYVSTRPEHIIEPHQRWATGFLLDNSTVGGLDLYNRGTAGSGHGWAIGNGVGWNAQALGSITVQSPPYSRNLCIGCSARSYAKSDKDCYILKGTRVEPPSLFETQLQQRIGQEASAKILNSILGLSTNTESEPNSIMDRQCAPMRTWFNNTALMHLAQQGRRENNARIFDILLPGSFGVTGY